MQIKKTGLNENTNNFKKERTTIYMKRPEYEIVPIPQNDTFPQFAPLFDFFIEEISRRLANYLGSQLSSKATDIGEDQNLNVAEAADFLHTTPDQIYQWVHQAKYAGGNFPFKKAGKRLLFSRKDLESWINKGKLVRNPLERLNNHMN